MADDALRFLNEVTSGSTQSSGQTEPIQNILQTLLSIPESARTRELPRELWLNYKDVLKNELNATAYSSLMRNAEVKNYPELATHIAGVLAELLDDYTNFLRITGISYNNTASQFYSKGVDFTVLGSYADFVAGKLAAGGYETPTKASAKGWFFLYRDFVNGKPSKYTKIMGQRIAVWEEAKVAPMWFWFANTVTGAAVKRAYPKNAPVPLYKDLDAVITLFLENINKELQTAGESVEVTVNIRPPEIDFSKYVPGVPEFKTTVTVKAAGGVQVTNLNYVLRMLETGTWKPTRAYVRKIGGEEVVVAELLVPKAGKQRRYSGFRLEFR